MKADLAVVGAGIAGSALTRMAREQGLKVTLIADPSRPPASHCAICVLRRSWRSKDERPDFDFTHGWYEAHGWVVTKQAVVMNKKRQTALQNDWSLVDPHGPLLRPDETRRVTPEQALESADRVVFATAFNGPFPADPLYGATAILPVAAMDKGHPLRAAHLGPYQCVQIARVGGSVRVGSSKGKTREAAIERCQKLVMAAADRKIIDPSYASQAEYLVGVRAVHRKPNGDKHWMRMSPNVWWMGGFARVGYSLAPSVARDVFKDLTSAH